MEAVTLSRSVALPGLTVYNRTLGFEFHLTQNELQVKSMVPTHTTAEQKHTRRWRVPPPLTRGPELMEGAEILREVSGEAAVLLWKSLRSVTLWATTDPRDQARLFSPGAGERRMAEILVTPVDDELTEPLQTFAALLDSPLSQSREAVALACRRVAPWAAKQQLTGTTLAFTQAAALVSPSDAGLAHEVGRLARAGGELARSESWHRRAIMLMDGTLVPGPSRVGTPLDRSSILLPTLDWLLLVRPI